MTLGFDIYESSIAFGDSGEIQFLKIKKIYKYLGITEWQRKQVEIGYIAIFVEPETLKKIKLKLAEKEKRRRRKHFAIWRRK